MSPLLLLVAIVVEDGSALRAAPTDTAPVQAELHRGDWLEVRGEEQGFLKVWHHRKERPGYVRAWRVRQHQLAPESARDLLTIALFLRDSPGMESLGIGYAAMYLRSAAPLDRSPSVFDAIGTMADRLARRASTRHPDPIYGPVAAHLDVATSYGVSFLTREADGRIVQVYDGEAFRQALALSKDASERARAALHLTRDDGMAAEAGAVGARLWNAWRLQVLAQAPVDGIPSWLGGRLALRRAECSARAAHDFMATGDAAGAAEAAREATRQLMLADRKALLPEDTGTYDRTAIQVGAVRFAATPGPAPAKAAVPARVAAREGGGSEVRIGEGSNEFRHGTASVTWPSSLAVAPGGAAAVASVSPTPSWTELLVLHRQGDGWSALALPPAPEGPGVGYVEPAGFSPDGSRLLLVREAIVDGKATRSFEVMRLADLAIERKAGSADQISAFRKWAPAAWRAETLALR